MNNERDYRLVIPRSIFELDLHPFEFSVFTMLWSHVVNYGEEWPSTETLAHECRMTPARVSKAIVGLEPRQTPAD
jgi:hypothetical protein